MGSLRANRLNGSWLSRGNEKSNRSAAGLKDSYRVRSREVAATHSSVCQHRRPSAVLEWEQGMDLPGDKGLRAV